jgi:hypothetical protein
VEQQDDVTVIVLKVLGNEMGNSLAFEPRIYDALVLMNCLKAYVTMVLLALWLPCTMHCQAEALGWLDSDATCCEASHSDESSKPDCSDCAACSSVESGGYSLPQKASFVYILLVVTLHFAPELVAPLREPAALTTFAPDSAPQLLRQSWSFHCRTAPAPRAPSLLG